MGQKYLVDTNSVIDYLNNKLPENSAVLFDTNLIYISAVTRMELLGWPDANES